MNSEQGLENSALTAGHARGKDKFRDIYPKVDWELQLNYAVKLGLGRRDYELIKI